MRYFNINISLNNYINYKWDVHASNKKIDNNKLNQVNQAFQKGK